jgi:hypothetical protein
MSNLRMLTCIFPAAFRQAKEGQSTQLNPAAKLYKVECTFLARSKQTNKT